MGLKQVYEGIWLWTIFMLLPALVRTADPNLQIPLNLAFGNVGGPQITNISQPAIFNYISEIKPSVSAVIPFLLNVNLDSTHLPTYQAILQNFTNANIKIYPAIGSQNASVAINDSSYIQIAQNYRPWTDCIQITDTELYVATPESVSQLNWMINYLNQTLKFQHIQLNPWPQYNDSEQTAYSFSNPAVDSAMEQVELDADHSSPYTVYSDPTNWTPNPNKIAKIMDVYKNAQFVINYENKPEEGSLTTLNHSQQINAFQTTINSINQMYGNNSQVHWMPPWSVNYDPFANNVWNFFVTQLSAGDP